MKILFSPSESKINGGELKNLDDKAFLFSNLYDKRLYALNLYNEFIKTASKDEVSKLFGLKKDFDIQKYTEDIFLKPIMKAVLRYDGVAYDYLKYRSLTQISKEFIDENVIIFSNLYGPILAKDEVVDYKLKQGENIPGFIFDKFYKDNFSLALDKYLQDEDILDLRAGFYDKFYEIKKPYLTLKFKKDSKVVSHWAKAYRGIVLRSVALNSVSTIKDFYDLNIDGLKVCSIIRKGLKSEIVFDITT
ncbi:YaaA family protein [Campylobacter hyointestinalis]|uniref:YaaA family protein n=1 Tax=Campylobacter hyointestinalis TaxID=198 RepID=UPI000DCCADAB|nr:YaaA family protein [Campylobacter hyointestinalis]RAZ55081.1 peroxide stress protein YaaA [Campylobacter hyointestinalis subsp. lawsonii]RAZ65447.1 peroxide stress protein YaaA [Campylobacter hyointestinalis subsp. lawsonii]